MYQMLVLLLLFNLKTANRMIIVGRKESYQIYCSKCDLLEMKEMLGFYCRWRTEIPYSVTSDKFPKKTEVVKCSVKICVSKALLFSSIAEVWDF